MRIASMSSEQIDREAAEWLARLDSQPESAALRAQFESWRSADARHAAAYLRLSIAWARMDRLSALSAGQSSVDSDALSARAERDRDATSDKSRNAIGYEWRRAAIAAGFVLLTIGSVVFVRSLSGETLTTQVGGFARARLTDGSTVELNTGTRLKVQMDDESRRVELVAGEATFSVAHDADRPFIVNAGEATVRAVGTRFNVRRRAESVDVLVTQGKVRVARARYPAGPEASNSALVSAGESALIAATHIERAPVTPALADRALAWHHGSLEFESSTLAEIVAEFNRYNERRIVIDDPDLATMQIGGRFSATNPDGFVHVLTDFGIRADITDSEIVLRRASRTQVR
jgi:transmembrane sensor